jgi:hypothetical protein
VIDSLCNAVFCGLFTPFLATLAISFRAGNKPVVSSRQLENTKKAGRLVEFPTYDMEPILPSLRVLDLHESRKSQEAMLAIPSNV